MSNINNFLEPLMGYTGIPTIDSSFNNTTSAANIAAALTDLMSYTLIYPSLLLAPSGSVGGVKIVACGTFAANGNSKTVKLLFGATTLKTVTSTYNNVAWRIEAEVFRLTATTQIANVISFFGSTPDMTVTSSTAAETPATASIIIKCQGQGTATNDVVQTILSVQNL